MFMMKPLAYSLAPSKIEDIVGQEHLVGKNGFIYKMIKNNKMTSIILYGKPGIGKTAIVEGLGYNIQIEYEVLENSYYYSLIHF